MGKLNQVIAVEKSIKSRAHADLSGLYKIVQKPDLFNGLIKVYKKKDEDGEDLPSEKKRVQYTVDTVLKSVEKSVSELLEITARKDWTNCDARGTVKVGETVIVADAPVSFLLFLEKTLGEVRNVADAIPVLDDAETWTKDTNSGLFVTAPIETHRTKKVQKPIVMYPATPEHPAQTVMITEDVIAGFWNQIKQSGALPKPQKAVLLEKVDALLRATKEAREAANGQEETKSPDVGKKVFDFLLGD